MKVRRVFFTARLLHTSFGYWPRESRCSSFDYLSPPLRLVLRDHRRLREHAMTDDDG